MALSVVLPWLFHAVGLGSFLLPMFYPILSAGFLTPFPIALTVGLLSPFVSSFLTGMPPLYPPMAFVISAEGAVLGSLPSILHHRFGAGIRISLAAALAAERVVLVAAITAAARWLDLPADFLGWASFLRSLPGVIVIFAIFPPLIAAVERKILARPVME